MLVLSLFMVWKAPRGMFDAFTSFGTGWTHLRDNMPWNAERAIDFDDLSKPAYIVGESIHLSAHELREF